MPHPRWLACTRVLPLVAIVTIAGCFTDGGNGDPGEPGRAFSAGTGTYPTSGDWGGAGTGYTGTGHAGSGYAGASGTAGAAPPLSGGAGNDGGADATATDGGTASDAKGPKPPGCTVGATATFAVAWSLEDATGADSTCAAVGGQTVDLDVVNLTTGGEALSTTPCAALAATTCAMRAGSYSISMKLRDTNGAVLSEVFAPLMFLVDGQVTALSSLPLQVGGVDAAKGRGFALTWSIDKKSTGAIESCTQAGAAHVRLTAGTTKFDLACADGKGRTTAVPPGSYPVVLDLLDGTGATLSETQTMTVPIAAGQLVFLGDVPFDVN
jgi:hypothetical protein